MLRENGGIGQTGLKREEGLSLFVYNFEFTRFPDTKSFMISGIEESNPAISSMPGSKGSAILKPVLEKARTSIFAESMRPFTACNSLYFFNSLHTLRPLSAKAYTNFSEGLALP